jgi:hypothetical protein
MNVDHTQQRINHQVDWATIITIVGLIYVLHKAGVLTLASSVAESLAESPDDTADSVETAAGDAVGAVPELSGGTA